jgi:spermidine synthase
MLLRAALVMFPFTILLGMTFPLVARSVCDDDDSIGRSLGNIYAANTCGSILGSVGAAFVLIPLLGLRNSLLALSALNVILGALCLWAEPVDLRRWVAVGVLVAAGLILPSLMIPKTIFFDALEPDTGKLVYYKEGITDTTSVLEWKWGGRVQLYGDGRGTAGTMTDRLNRTLGHLAHLLHPDPRRSLQIGFGVGNTLAAAALHPEVEQLDCAELSGHVRETATYFWTNQGVLDDPKVNLIVDDGRNYVLRTRTRYEVITLEPPNIYTASVVNLYTREFYELASEAMTDDGILMQWIAVGDVNDAELEQLVRAMVDVFPHITLWDEGPMAFFKGPTGYLLVVGSKQPLRIDVGELERRMKASEIRDDLQRIGLASPAKLLSLFIAGDQGARRWTADAVAVTDDKTVVDYSTAKSVTSGFGLGFFRLEGEARHRWFQRFTEIGRLYQKMREPIDPLLVNVSDPEKLRAEIQAYQAAFDRSVDEWEVARGPNAPNP